MLNSASLSQPMGKRSHRPAHPFRPVAIPPMPSETNDPAPQLPDAATLLRPVRDGLRFVESKMKEAESSAFAPLANAYVELINSGGKRIRPALALMAATFHGHLSHEENQGVIALAAAVEMLHTASLVHDDVIDGALLRRGSPTLNANWSQGSTVLAGNYMFAQAAHFAAETANMRVIHIFSDTLAIIVDGEIRQLRARYQYNQERDEYYHRIYAKTASLFSAATESGAVLSGLPDDKVADLQAYGYNLGMAFQIVDDILDFVGDEKSLGKPAGSDLRQGTLTLPFFYFLKDHPHPQSVLDRLEEGRWQAEEGNLPVWRQTVQELVGELLRTDAPTQALQEAAGFIGQARHNLEALADNECKTAMLGLCEFVLRRHN